MNALILMPLAAAARRSCLASWSSSEIVVLMMHDHNTLASVHHTFNRLWIHLPEQTSIAKRCSVADCYFAGMVGRITWEGRLRSM